MKYITKEEMKNYETYLYKRGRDIEIAKYNYFFLDEERIDVAMALSIYQNRDGGFGHGLEPDSLNPYSSPLQTSEGLRILKSVLEARSIIGVKSISNLPSSLVNVHGLR